MGVVLSDIEQTVPFAGDYGATLGALQERLAALQLAQTVHGGRSIVLFDGWQGSGRKAALKLLACALDPCHLAARDAALKETPDGRHWLARYWSSVPAAGQTCVFLGSWHADAVGARLSGELGDKEWARSCDEINEFEAQQTDHGTALIKLFFHVSPQVQAARLGARAADPWRRWTMQPDEACGAAARDVAQPLWDQLLTLTDTRWAGWTIVDCSDEQAAAIAALEAVARGLEKVVPAAPPATGDKVVALGGLKG